MDVSSPLPFLLPLYATLRLTLVLPCSPFLQRRSSADLRVEGLRRLRGLDVHLARRGRFALNHRVAGVPSLYPPTPCLYINPALRTLQLELFSLHMFFSLIQPLLLCSLLVLLRTDSGNKLERNRSSREQKPAEKRSLCMEKQKK